MKILYTIDDETDESAIHEVQTGWITDSALDSCGAEIASEMAHDYHTHRDGYEDANWPLCINLHNEDCSVHSSYSVEREIVPSFSAQRIQ